MKSSTNHKETPKTAYLTKRILVSTAGKAIRQAAKESMEIMGYVVIAHDGWVVKKYADGRIEKMSKLENVERPAKIKLD